MSRGLFGPLIIESKEPQPDEALDIPVVFHEWDTKAGAIPALGRTDGLQRIKAAPGTRVRMRLINADNFTQTFQLIGTSFKVVAIDGNPIHQPGELEKAHLQLGAGGRYDITFTMPDHPVFLARIGDPEHQIGILLSQDGQGEPPEVSEGPIFDPASYGMSKSTPFGPESQYDRVFVIDMFSKLGFFNGDFGMQLTINGEVFPQVPMLMVREGELVKTVFINRTSTDHPMHLHGHHMLVLSKNGKLVTGSPWWTDTLNVKPGETYEVAFRANNPGLWMDHCHNLLHAANGMTLHLAYEGVTSPFQIGSSTRNPPEFMVIWRALGN